MRYVALILSFSLLSLAVLRCMLEVSNSGAPPPNYWVSLTSREKDLMNRVTKNGGTVSCLETDPALVRELARVYLLEGKMTDCSKLLTMLWEHDVKDTSRPYDSTFVADAMDMAAMSQAQGSFEHSVNCYKTVLDYDSRRLDRTDPALVRDYNNLGVGYYMWANAEKNPVKSRKYFAQSKEMYFKAKGLSEQGKAPTAIPTIDSNMRFLARDAGDLNNLK